ncbi:hypothetical protein AB0C88_37535 [Streptomyces chartreusis]|uniref:hypothetical protein n=1 Tax=Streptomyces chartreusis TaxID=1969 RepID=UPI0034084451
MQSVAPFVAAFRRRLANLPGPTRSVGVASSGEPATVEILVGGEWVNITDYSMVRDNSGQIRITYGIQGGEGSQTEPATTTLELLNDDARFSHRNPMGPWFDSLNWDAAQIRVSVPDGNGGITYRIWGEVSEWVHSADRSGRHVWVDATVNGFLQKLAQGPAPERSVIYRAVTTPLLTGLVAYWPCEDAEGAKSLSSALVNGSPMTWTGNPVLATYTGFEASDPLPTLTGASLSGGIAKYDASVVTQYQMRYLLAVPADGFTDQDVISRIAVEAGAYNLRYLDVHYNDPPGGVGSFGGRGTLTVQAYDGDESPLATSGTPSISLDTRGRQLRVSVEVSNNGSALSMTLRVLDVDSGITDFTTIGLVSTQVTRVTSVGMAPDTLAGSAGVIAAAVGHVTVQTTISDITDLGDAIHPTGEAAGRRIQRLCGEEGIAFSWVGDLDDTVALGAQGRQNVLALAQEACLADGGLLYEARTGFGLGYRTRASLSNQDAALVLSVSAYNLDGAPVPVDDDRQTQNILTVTAGGVSATYEETEGPLGTAAIGKYGENEGLTLNLASSDTANVRDHAAWRVHLGTVDEDRFPSISVNLAHPSITPEMRRAVLALRLGDRVQISDPEPWQSYDPIDQLVLGIEESLTRFEHKLTFICAPASPYTVGVLDSAAARLDTDGSALVSAVTSSDTALTVGPSNSLFTRWTTDSAEMPFDVRAGGEVMRVTAIADHLSDTFTRVTANGWGTADSGQAWTNVNAANSDFSTDGSVALHSVGSVNSSRYSILTTLSLADVDIRADMATSVTAAGGPHYSHIVARYVNANNMYAARLRFNTDQTIDLSLQKRVGGTQTDIATVAIAGTHAGAAFFTVRFQIAGTTLRAKAWGTGTVEPGWLVVASDGAHQNPGPVGVRSVLDSANSNVLPVAFSYDNYRVLNPQTFTVTRSVNGVVKAHQAGVDVRLATPTILAL